MPLSATLTQFAKQVLKGKGSSASVDQEIAHANDAIQDEDGGASYYKLAKLLGDSPTNTLRALMSQVKSGQLDSTFLMQFLPLIGSVDPELIDFFTQGAGAKLLQVVSDVYSQGQLNLSKLAPLLLDQPEAQQALETAQQNYHSGGIEAVNPQDLIVIFSSLDFGGYAEDSTVISTLFADIVTNRGLTLAMLNRTLRQLKQNKVRRHEERDEKQRELELAEQQEEKQGKLQEATREAEERAASDRGEAEEEEEKSEEDVHGVGRVGAYEESPDIISDANS